MLKDVLAAIENTIKVTLPELKQVQLHGGGFSGIEDIKNFATFAPAVRVGLSNIENQRTNDGRLYSKLSLSLLLITKDKLSINSRHVLALDYIETLTLLVESGKWKNKDNKYLENVFKTEDGSISSRNYYGPTLFNEQIAIWGLSWQQKVLIGKSVFDDKDFLPKNYEVNTDIGTEKKR